MPVIPDLRRFDPVDDAHVWFKGCMIPKGWEMPENVWAVVQRMDRVQDAATALYDCALMLLRSASHYVRLINRRDDFLFRRDDNPRISAYSRPPQTINDVLCLTLKTSAVTDWNYQYFAARRDLNECIAAFESLIADAEFLRLAYPWFPVGSINRIDLDKWYQANVQRLVSETPNWRKFDFAFRDILLEITARRRGTRILGDVLASADLTGRMKVFGKRQELYNLGTGSVDQPQCRLAWVTQELAKAIENQDRGSGPIF